MKRIDEIRFLVADLDVVRTNVLGKLPVEEEETWRRIQGRLEDLVREERRVQSENPPAYDG